MNHMKKILFYVLALALMVSPALAAHKHKEKGAEAEAADPTDSSDSYWYLGVGPLLSLPVQDINTFYGSGIGGTAYVGYQVNKDVALELDLDNVSYSASNGLSDYELRAMPTVKYFLGGKDLQPYLLGGLGLDLQFASASGISASGTSIEENLGVGCKLKLAHRTYVFLEVKYDFIFSSGVTGEDLPIIAGLEFGL